MKTARHENVFGFKYGQRSAYESFTPFEIPLIDFRLNLPEQDSAHLKMQYGLPGIQPDIVMSPSGEAWARKQDEIRMEAILLELKTHIRIA